MTSFVPGVKAANPGKALADLPPGIRIVNNPIELMTYAADAGLEHGQPDLVAFPRTAEDVVRLVKWAAGHGVGLIARGAGTGTSGGAIAEQGGLLLVFSAFNRVTELDEDGRSATVEPGVVNAVLDESARARGLFFPPDPASGRTCTLGGNIAENAGGPRCCKYGVTSNYVTGLRAVLSDGRAVQFGGQALDYPEYDFTGVLTGSEGTLGIMVAADVRLLRQPPASSLLMAAFASVEAAGEAVSAVIAAGLVPATMEMMDQIFIRMIEEYAHLGLPRDAGALLIVEVDGYAESLPAQMAEVAATLTAHGAFGLVQAESAAERERIWSARKSSAGALARLAPAFYPSDCTVPRSKIAQALTEINRICAADRLRVCYLLHAGDGNLHPHLLIDDPADPELMRGVLAAEAQALEFCVAQGGSITGEHGVGSERRDFMPLMFTEAELSAMREVKDVFDLAGRLNPGKIFPLPASRASEPGPALSERSGEAAARRVGACAPIVFAPATAAEAAEMIVDGLAGDRSRTIRLRGGGSKSKALPPADVTLATANLSGIRAYAPDDLYVTVGAGTRLTDLQAELAAGRLWLPAVSPWPEATVGGSASAALNAPLRMRYGYGAWRDLVLACEVALPDGRLIRVGRPVVKNVAGYDLPKLFAGAHGTLGLITELTLRLTPRPRRRASLVVPVPDAATGLAWGQKLQAVCLGASALLLVSGGVGLAPDAPLTLIYTAEGLAEDVAAELSEARRLLESAGAAGISRRDDVDGSEVWAEFLRAAEGSGGWLRAGLPRRDFARALGGLAPRLAGAAYLADLANGMLYTGGLDLATIELVRREVRLRDGYAVLNGPAGYVWDYSPQSLPLMRALKARWDAQARFNPNAFIV